MTDILLTTESLRRRGQKTSFDPAENEGSGVCSCSLTGSINYMYDVIQLIELHRAVDEHLGQHMSLDVWEMNILTGTTAVRSSTCLTHISSPGYYLLKVNVFTKRALIHLDKGLCLCIEIIYMTEVLSLITKMHLC